MGLGLRRGLGLKLGFGSRGGLLLGLLLGLGGRLGLGLGLGLGCWGFEKEMEIRVPGGAEGVEPFFAAFFARRRACFSSWLRFLFASCCARIAEGKNRTWATYLLWSRQEREALLQASRCLERVLQEWQAQQPLHFALASLSSRLSSLDAEPAFLLGSNLYSLLAELEFLLGRSIHRFLTFFC